MTTTQRIATAAAAGFLFLFLRGGSDDAPHRGVHRHRCCANNRTHYQHDHRDDHRNGDNPDETAPMTTAATVPIPSEPDEWWAYNPELEWPVTDRNRLATENVYAEGRPCSG